MQPDAAAAAANKGFSRFISNKHGAETKEQPDAAAVAKKLKETQLTDALYELVQAAESKNQGTTQVLIQKV